MFRPNHALLLTILFCLAPLAGGCGGQHLPNLHVVEQDVLIRGGQPDAVGLAALRDRYGVGTVVNLNDKTTDEELVATVALGMDYLPLPIKTADLPEEKLLVFFADGGGRAGRRAGAGLRPLPVRPRPHGGGGGGCTGCSKTAGRPSGRLRRRTRTSSGFTACSCRR